MTKRYALITGASGGIGSAIAKKLLEENYAVYLHYNKNKTQVEHLRTEYHGKEVYTVQADLSKQGGTTALLNQIHHPIDALILNSGSSYVGLVTDMAEVKIEEMVQLHITSPFLIAKSLLPSMVSEKSGNIVVVTSIWGEIGASCEVLYSMVKGGQNTFVKALAKEVAPSNIRVNAVSPGAIMTNMLNHFSQDDLSDLKDAIPMGRLGNPEEIANVVTFLLSDGSSYINGQIISVNGAWHT